jgi:hypothetical protein
MVIVLPGAQPPSEKSKRPWGKVTPGGELPAGGLSGSPMTGMKRAAVKLQVAPPPVSTAVMGPVPVALGPVNTVVRVGVKETVVDAGPVPVPFVATTEQVYGVPFARPVIRMGEATSVAVKAPGLQVTV